MAKKCHNYFRGGQLRANPIRGYKIDMAIWLCGYVAMWLCGYVAMWLCG